MATTRRTPKRKAKARLRKEIAPRSTTGKRTGAALSIYERGQTVEICEWRAATPSVFSQAASYALSSVSSFVGVLIPRSAITAALSLSSSVAQWLTYTKDIARKAGVTSIAELKHQNLEKLDVLANSVHNWAIGMATVEGGATGAAGLPGMAIDIPAIILLALRTIHKIGVCYGFEVQTEADKEFILAVLAASSANTMKEKCDALLALREVEVLLLRQSWKAMARTSTAKRTSKAAAVIAIRTLAKQLGVNITKRKALQAIPIVGGAVGASVNAWYVKEVGWAARRAFQERWLFENGKLGLSIDVRRSSSAC